MHFSQKKLWIKRQLFRKTTKLLPIIMKLHIFRQKIHFNGIRLKKWPIRNFLSVYFFCALFSTVYSSMRAALWACIITLCLLTIGNSVGTSKTSSYRLSTNAQKHMECCRKKGCPYTIFKHLNKCEIIIYGQSCRCTKWTINVYRTSKYQISSYNQLS